MSVIVMAAAAGMILVIMVGGFFRSRPMAVLYSTSAIACLAWDFPALPGVVIGGFDLQPEDLLVMASAVAGCLNRASFNPRIRLSLIPLLTFFGALTASVIIGIVDFGTTAVNEARGLLYPIILCLWAITLPLTRDLLQVHLPKWATVSSIMLVVGAVYHAVVYGLGASNEFTVSKISGVEQTARPMTGGQALLLALLVIYLFTLTNKPQPRLQHAITAVGAMALLASQERSVWIATIVGIATIVTIGRGSVRARLVIASGIALLAVAIISTAASFHQIFSDVSTAASDAGTYDARQVSWVALIDQTIEGGPLRILFGQPFGSGWERYEGDRLIEYAPHNWYVTLYLRLGLLGVAALVLILASIAVRLIRARNATGAAITFGTMVFCWAYSLPLVAAPLFGLAVSSAITQRMAYSPTSNRFTKSSV